jgi:hypothetical protein
MIGLRASRSRGIGWLTLPLLIALSPWTASSATRPAFADVSDRLGQVPGTAAAQPSGKPSNSAASRSPIGPGITWFDADGDGWEDLIRSGSNEGGVSILRNNGAGAFVQWPQSSLAGTEDENIATLGWEGDSPSRRWLAGTAHRRIPSPQPTRGHIWLLQNPMDRGAAHPLQVLPQATNAAGPMAMADIDLDGHLDLFIGGGSHLTKDSAASPARLFRGTTNGFTIDPDNDLRLARVERVSGATFADLNADGRPDLALAVESGSIRVFLNEHGRMMDTTSAWGLDKTPGEWTSIATGDFNSDGSLDLVVGGRKPPGGGIGTESSVFLNRQGQLHRIPLPAEAQASTAFGLVVADLDGDGVTDLFLAPVSIDITAPVGPLDATAGLALLGLGAGKFQALTAEASGIRFRGEPRGAAASDFDADGKVDLAVAYASGATALFHNLTGQSGLRVFLRINRPERWAVGAVARAIYATGEIGPAWEVRLGGGYYSQDSPILLLGKRSQLASLWVRWPGGHVTIVKVPPQARDLQVDPLGVVKVLR